MSDLIDPYLDWLRSRSMSARTVGDRAGILHRADVGTRRVEPLPFGLDHSVEAEIVAWLARPRLHASARSTYFHALRSFYCWATRPGHELLDLNPMSGMVAPRVPSRRARPVDRVTVARVLAESADPWRLHILLATLAGLRCVEIAGLRREDVTERHLLLRAAKGGDPQTVPCHPEIWRTLRNYPPGPVVEHAGGVADARWVSIRTALYFRRELDLPGVSLHRFRHSFGTELRRRGHDLFVIQRALRHRSIASTQIYVDVEDGERDLAVATLPVPTPDSQQTT